MNKTKIEGVKVLNKLEFYTLYFFWENFLQSASLSAKLHILSVNCKDLIYI